MYRVRSGRCIFAANLFAKLAIQTAEVRDGPRRLLGPPLSLAYERSEYANPGVLIAPPVLDKIDKICCQFNMLIFGGFVLGSMSNEHILPD